MGVAGPDRLRPQQNLIGSQRGRLTTLTRPIRVLRERQKVPIVNAQQPTATGRCCADLKFDNRLPWHREQADNRLEFQRAELDFPP